MSQRLGMADGRCFTIGTSSRLLNDYVMKTNKINYQDNYSYRRMLQIKGPDIMEEITSKQNTKPTQASINQCQACDVPLLAVPNTR